MHTIDIEKARREMARLDVDVLVAASVVNVCYCTGHYSKIWASLRDHLRLAVIPRDSAPFVTCPDVEANSFARSGVFEIFEYPIDVYFKYPPGEDLYLKAKENVRDIPELQDLGVRDLLARSPVRLAAKVLRDRGFSTARIAVDKEYVQTAFFEELAASFPGAEMVDGTPIFLRMRTVKTPAEIATMREAVRVAEDAMLSALPLVREGSTLFELHQHFVRELAAEEGSEPEHVLLSVSPVPTGEVFSSMKDRLGPGKVLKADVGAIWQSYTSDFCRQWAIGPIPDHERAIFDRTLEAVDAMVALLGPGTPMRELYRVGADVMKKSDPDYGRRLFLGHSIGLENHERPYITPFTEEVLEPGMVLCIEVPYYAAGGYAYNPEDEYLITQTGHELLTQRVDRAMPQV